MPDKTICPRCQKVGFVRTETILTRGREVRAFYCGACNSSWETSADGRQSGQDHSTDPPDRSRTR